MQCSFSFRNIGAGSRGQLPPLGDILTPPGRLLPPRRLVSWAIFGKKNAQIRRRLLLKNAPYPAKTFFLENACFWDKKTLLIRRRPFFWRTLLFGTKKRSNSSEDLYFVFPTWSSRSCPPCPKIVPAPLFRKIIFPTKQSLCKINNKASGQD